MTATHIFWLMAWIVMLVGCGAGSGQDQPKQQAPNLSAAVGIDQAELRRRISILASDEFEGRAPMTRGGLKTRQWLMEEFKQMGLEPMSEQGYEQVVPLVERTLHPQSSFLAINGLALQYGAEAMYWTSREDEQTQFKDSPLVFVGYGVVAPEYGWNDYEGIDVTGKTVVILANDPGLASEDPDLFNGRAMTYYGRWTYKYEEAARQGATAALIVHNTEAAGYGWGVIQNSWSLPLLDLERTGQGKYRSALEGWVQESIARRLFEQANLDFDKVASDALNSNFQAVELSGLTASATLSTTIRRDSSANVAGVIRGTDKPDEYVVYLAHWDHLGMNSEPAEDQIYNGAVDNATGVAGILAIADMFAKQPPRRSVIVLAVTAEESGLLGSAYFSDHPPVPLANIVGGFNIDGALPAPPTRDLVVIGYGSSQLEDLLRTSAQRKGKHLRPEAEPEKGYFYRSDHISFSKKGVPMLFADSGVELIDGGETAGKALSADYVANVYHNPSDEYQDDWDLSGFVESLHILHETGANLANSDAWPNWYEGNEFRALRDAQRVDSP